MKLPPHNALPTSAVWATAVNDALNSLERSLAAANRRIDTLTATNDSQLDYINRLRATINTLERR